MAQNSNRLAHDEESDAQALRWRGIQAGERLENPGNLFARNSNAGVVHIDPDTRTGVPAAKKDPTSRLRVLDCVADQITQGGAEEKTIAQYRDIAGNHVDAYALAPRCLFVLTASLPQDLMDAYRPQLETPRAFPDTQRSQYLLQLLLEPVDRILTGAQTLQLGVRSNPKPEEFVSALNNLERLAKIVTRYRKEHGHEIRNFVRSSGRRHAPRYVAHVRFPADG